SRVLHPSLKGQSDGDVVVGAVLDRDRITRADLTRGQNAEIGSRYPGFGERLDPARPVQEGREGPARCAWGGHLEQQRAGPDAPSFADPGLGQIDTDGGEVLAEHPVGERDTELNFPA